MPASPPTAPESATTALYRAALGPVNTAHHLPVFERFDAAGRASPAWNWAAGLLTLNWLLFRQLWGAALIYLACAGGLLLLVLGPLREWWAWPLWPTGVQWGALGTLVLLSIALPGAFGPAILHGDTRRRITLAVRQASTVREACATLEQRASTRRRLWGLVVLNGLLALVVLALVSWLRPGAPATVAAETRLTPPTQSTPEALPVVAEPAAAPPPAGTARAAEAPATGAASVRATAETETPALASTPAAPEPPASPAPDGQATGASADAAPAPATEAPARPARSAARRSSPADDQPQAHGINVGLFADRANAEKVQARLVEAGFPAILQSTESAKGTPLTRVRVGPLASRAQAQQAAGRIRAMGLDAHVFVPGS